MGTGGTIMVILFDIFNLSDDVLDIIFATKQQKIIARAYNQMEMLRDPTAHAEMIALTQASETLSDFSEASPNTDQSEQCGD